MNSIHAAPLYEATEDCKECDKYGQFTANRQHCDCKGTGKTTKLIFPIEEFPEWESLPKKRETIQVGDKFQDKDNSFHLTKDAIINPDNKKQVIYEGYYV